MLDLAAIYHSKATLDGKFEGVVETIIPRPAGGVQVVVQRFVHKDGSAKNVAIETFTIGDLSPSFRRAYTYPGGVDTETVDHQSVLGVTNAGVVLPGVGSLSDVTPLASGYMSFKHSEIKEMYAGTLDQNASARIARIRASVSSTDIANNHSLDSLTGTDKSLEALITQAPAFPYSRWVSQVYRSHPKGEHSFSPFSGVVAAKAAGERVKAEKRTFDKKYVRPNGETYFGRQIQEIDDVEVLQKAREHNENVLLYGPPGTGKTALAEAAFMNNGDSGMITMMGTAETEVADLVGSYTQRPGEGFVWIDGPLIEAMEHGKALLVDEIGLIDPKVLSILYSVMDGRGELKVTMNPDRGTVKAKEGFYVIAATNPHAPGVQLSEALLSRFTIQVEVDSDYDLAKHLKVNAKIVTAAKQMDRRRMSGDMLWAPQLRELFAFKRNEQVFGITFAARALIAGAPEMDRDIVADSVSKALGETVSPLRMEG